MDTRGHRRRYQNKRHWISENGLDGVDIVCRWKGYNPRESTGDDNHCRKVFDDIPGRNRMVQSSHRSAMDPVRRGIGNVKSSKKFCGRCHPKLAKRVNQTRDITRSIQIN